MNKAKPVCQTLEELASTAARTRLQSRCFVRRQDIQTNAYKIALFEGLPRDDENTQSPLLSKLASLEIRTIAGMRYARAKTARLTLLYGESPWRVIALSLGFMLAVALIYPLNEWLRPADGVPITYTQIAQDPSLFLESLYFSTLTFTTLGMGGYEPLGWGQVIVTLNTTFGAILLRYLSSSSVAALRGDALLRA